MEQIKELTFGELSKLLLAANWEMFLRIWPYAVGAIICIALGAWLVMKWLIP